MRVDIHTHSFPAHKAREVLAALALKAKSQCPLVPAGDGTIADLAQHESEAGIDRFAVCPIAVRPSQHTYMVKFLTATQNGSCGEIVRRRIIPAASLHPADPDLKSHLQELLQAGIKLLKVHPYFQDVPLNSPQMFKLFEACAEVGLPVLAHTGGDISYEGTPMAAPTMVLEVATQLPELKFIAAHCAAWRSPETVNILLGQPVNVDLSFQPWEGMDLAVRTFAENHPQERLFFGSDWPWASPKQHAERIAAWNLPQERLDALMGGNAQRFLQLTP